MIATVVYYNMNAFFIIFLIDLFLKTICYSIKENIRWFQLHSIVNWIIVYFTYNDFIICMKNPNDSTKLIENEWGRSFALSLHIYHCLAFSLRKEDWIHHISSVFISCPMLIINNIKTKILLKLNY